MHFASRRFVVGLALALLCWLPVPLKAQEQSSGCNASAVAAVRLLAEQGDAGCQGKLGFAYEFGQGVPQDYAEAMRWYRLSAEQGNAYGQFGLGDMYWRGRSVPQNYAEAARWCRLAADQGLSRAHARLAYMYSQGLGVPQDVTEAARWMGRWNATMLPAARKTSANGQIAQAYMSQGYLAEYLMANRPQDYIRPQVYAEAAWWYRLAAERGHSDGQNRLGYMYSLGRGVPQDYAESARWFRLSAEQGNAVGQASLGHAYELGQSVPQDYVQAHMWYNLSGAQGLDFAVEGRNRVAASMTPAQIAEAQRLAREWRPTRER